MDISLYILLFTFIVIVSIIIYYYVNITSKISSKYYNPDINPYLAHSGKKYNSGLLY